MTTLPHFFPYNLNPPQKLVRCRYRASHTRQQVTVRWLIAAVLLGSLLGLILAGRIS